MAFGGGKLEWSFIQNEGEIVTVLELQQHTVSLFWTSEGAKGKQVGDQRKTLTAKAQSRPSPRLVSGDKIGSPIAYNSASIQR